VDARNHISVEAQSVLHRRTHSMVSRRLPDCGPDFTLYEYKSVLAHPPI
jgi:hypothetical protein